MNGLNLVDKYSFIFAAIIMVFALLLFFSQTNELMGSFAAAILAAGLAWIAYVLMRWLILSFRSRG